MNFPHFYRIAKDISAVFGVLVFFTVAFFVAVTMWHGPAHQFNVWKLRRHFNEVMHPPESQTLKSIGGFGSLFRDASNGCDYLVGELRISTGQREEITRRYQGLSIRSFNGSERVPVEVKFLDDEEFFRQYMGSNPWREWREDILLSFDFRSMRGVPYIVFAEQTDFPPEGDMRCFYTPLIK